MPRGAILVFGNLEIEPSEEEKELGLGTWNLVLNGRRAERFFSR